MASSSALGRPRLSLTILALLAVFASTAAYKYQRRRMSSTSKSVVTKTTRTMGPDGKMVTCVKTEETVTRDGKTTVTSSEKCSEPKKSGFGSFFKSKSPTHGGAIGSASAGGATQPKKLDLDSFRKTALKQINQYRQQHGVAPLKYDSKMNTYAQNWAEKIAQKGTLMHNPDKKYGENVYYGMNSRGIDEDQVVEAWYAEIGDYNFKKPGFGSNTGHFTQVVWKGSKELGIGMVQPNDREVYVVANFDPPGNVMGRFEENVFPKRA